MPESRAAFYLAAAHATQEISHIQKRYFSISEVAKLLDVKPSLLRFWEKEFKQMQPKTNARGKRAYKQKEDIDIIRRIYDLVKVQGLTLEGAKSADLTEG